MKIKLIRIFSLIFVLSSVLSLVPAQPALADPVTEAIKIIVSCKGKNQQSQAGSMCHQYERCIYGEPGDREGSGQYCNTVERLNPTISALSGATLEGCRRTMTHEQCTDAFVKCLQSKLDDGGGGLDPDTGIPGAETDKCKAAIAKGDATGGTKKEEKPAEEKSTCVVDGIGWLVCPVMTFLSAIVDGAYSVVASLLTVQPLLTNTSDPNNSTYIAWSMMRNIANVAFVIAFLIIIFSQVSSVGITNYGIKKMLPRLVVAAVLVNISYWLCAIAVDVSNILGTSMKDVFDSVKASLAVPDAGAFGEGNGWQGITGSVLAAGIAGTLIYINLAALVPALVMVLLAIVVVFLVLTLRQALIILLIVIAPLAFVAYLLPNTESMFKKWKDLLQTLLLMYPIIALIFGASALASKIVMASAEGNPAQKIPVQIMGAMVAIIPLALTPIVMKTAGSTLGKFGGMINNPNRGPAGWAKNRAEGFRDWRKAENKTARINRGKSLLEGEDGKLGGKYSRRRKIAATLGSVGATNTRDRERRDAFASAIAEETAQEYFATRAVNEEGFAKKLAGGDERKAAGLQASAQAEVKKIFDQDVANREVLERANPKTQADPQAAFQQAIADGDNIRAVALQNILYKSGSGGVSKFREAVEKAEQSTDGQVQAGLSQVNEALRTNVRENHGQYAKQKGADVVAWANAKPDETTGQTKKLSATASPDLDNNELAGQHSGSIAKMASQGKITAEQAQEVLKDPRTKANLNPAKRAVLENVAGYGRPGQEPVDPKRLDIAHEQAIEEYPKENEAWQRRQP